MRDLFAHLKDSGNRNAYAKMQCGVARDIYMIGRAYNLEALKGPGSHQKFVSDSPLYEEGWLGVSVHACALPFLERATPIGGNACRAARSTRNLKAFSVATAAWRGMTGRCPPSRIRPGGIA